MADEYIRKQDAFDALEARIAELMTHPEFRRKHLDIDLGGVIRNISAIKPADVVRTVHGIWIEDEGEGYYGIHCSRCNFPILYGNVMMGYNFCPNCGAKMDAR